MFWKKNKKKYDDFDDSKIFSAKSQKKLIKSAAIRSSKDQIKLVEEYNKKFSV